METQTRLSRHNKFISAENIILIFPDDLTEFKSPSNCTIYVLNVNFVIPQRINRELTIAIH